MGLNKIRAVVLHEGALSFADEVVEICEGSNHKPRRAWSGSLGKGKGKNPEPDKLDVAGTLSELGKDVWAAISQSKPSNPT